MATLSSEPSFKDVMSQASSIEWDLRSPEVQSDQLASYDAMRSRCPVAHTPDDSWVVFSHSDTVRILDDPETFSNEVSAHLAVPNGFDGSRHAAYRTIIESYFTAERLAAFEPVARAICAELIAGLARDCDIEVMSSLGDPFAAWLQCAFMGWPTSMRTPLAEWVDKNHAANRSGDRRRMAAVADEFDSFIREQLDARRSMPGPPDDPTTRLLAESVDGVQLSDAEIVSIIRNWTVGELATIAAAVGIALNFLAEHPDIQRRIRSGEWDLDAVTDELQRLGAPLIANRRRTTKPVEVGGVKIPAEEKVIVLWASANRDEAVFGDPDAFEPIANRRHNLVYGKGLHYCPGADLARLELRVLLEELFAATISVEPGTQAPAPAHYPAGGFDTVHIRLR